MRNLCGGRVGLISEWDIIREKTPNTETSTSFIPKVHFYFLEKNNEQEGE